MDTIPLPQSKRRRLPVRYLAALLLLLLLPVALVFDLRYLAGVAARRHLDAGIQAMQARDPVRAEREWRTALQLDPKRPDSYQLLSALYLDSDHPEKAILLLQRLRQIAPGIPHTLSRLAEAYALTDQSKLALETARQAVAQEPDDANAHALLGIQLGNRQDQAGAVSELSKATALDPTDDKIAISLAQAQLDAADLDGAARTAQRVITRNPGYTTAYYVLGWSFSRRTPTPDNVRQATAALEKLTQLDPRRADAFAEIGRLRGLIGDERGARTALEKAWQLGLHSDEVAYNLAAAYRKTGDTRRAAQMQAQFRRISDFHARYDALQKHLAVNPTDARAALDMVELDLRANRIDLAQPLLLSVLRTQARDKRALDLAATLYARLGDYARAQAFRQRAAAVQSAAIGGLP